MDSAAFAILKEYLGFTSPLGEDMNDPLFSVESLLEKVNGMEQLLNAHPDHFMSPSQDPRALRRLRQIAVLVENGWQDEDDRYKLANALSWCMQGYGNATDCAEEYRNGCIEDAVHMMG